MTPGVECLLPHTAACLCLPACLLALLSRVCPDPRASFSRMNVFSVSPLCLIAVAHVYTRARPLTLIRTRTRICIRLLWRTFAFTRTRTYTHVHDQSRSYLRAHAHADSHSLAGAPLHLHVRALTHTYTTAHAHTYMHTRTHTHMQTPIRSLHLHVHARTHVMSIDSTFTTECCLARGIMDILASVSLIGNKPTGGRIGISVQIQMHFVCTFSINSFVHVSACI